MDTLKIKTLEQLSDAAEIVEEARADKGLSRAEKLELEKAAVTLRHLERAIIKIVQNDLVDKLTTDAEALKDIAVKIKESSKKLAGVSVAIGKAAKVVESFIKLITSAAASGLI